MADSEPWLRLLPLLLVGAAALTVLATSWLTPSARVITAGVLMLSDYGLYLAGLIRPYALAMWLALGSTLLFWAIVVRGARSARAHAAFVVVTILMIYVLSMGTGVLVAEGVCLCVAVAVAWPRLGAAETWRRYGRIVIAVGIVGVAQLPYTIAVSRLNTGIGHTSISAQLAAAFNPRHYVSGPLYLLAMPFHLGLIFAVTALSAAGVALVRRDAAVGILCAIVAIQIAMTHGLLEGRSALVPVPCARLPGGVPSCGNRRGRVGPSAEKAARSCGLVRRLCARRRDRPGAERAGRA